MKLKMTRGKTRLAGAAAFIFLTGLSHGAGNESAEAGPRPEEKGPAASADAKLKTFKYDCESWPDGVPPSDLFVVDGTVKVGTKDGSRVIIIDPVPIVDAVVQLGDSAAGTSTVQAKVLASKKGRSYPRFGVSVHGLTGNRLMVNCAKKQLELTRGDDVLATAPFAWASDTWVQLKLEAILTPDGKWKISGKAWPAGTDEPKEPAVTTETTLGMIKGNGKAAIWGTPFSELPIYFDDLIANVATK